MSRSISDPMTLLHVLFRRCCTSHPLGADLRQRENTESLVKRTAAPYALTNYVSITRLTTHFNPAGAPRCRSAARWRRCSTRARPSWSRWAAGSPPVNSSRTCAKHVQQSASAGPGNYPWRSLLLLLVHTTFLDAPCLLASRIKLRHLQSVRIFSMKSGSN